MEFSATMCSRGVEEVGCPACLSVVEFPSRREGRLMEAPVERLAQTSGGGAVSIISRQGVETPCRCAPCVGAQGEEVCSAVKQSSW